MKKELIPLKKNLRCLYEAKQECDDTTVHIKVSTNTREIHETLDGRTRAALLLVCKHVGRGVRKHTRFIFRVPNLRLGEVLIFEELISYNHCSTNLRYFYFTLSLLVAYPQHVRGKYGNFIIAVVAS